MRLFPAKIPQFIKRIFPNYVWDFSSKGKTIYLTFDDGPTPEITEWTLDMLKQYNAKATFFCIGNNVAKHPEIFQLLLKEGHSIGNHTQDHVKGWSTSTEKYIDNVIKAETIISKALVNSQYELSLFRPPFGQIKKTQGKALARRGYKVIMWSVVAFDWDNKISRERSLKNVINATSEKNNIIIFHDSVKASRNMTYALPKVLAHFSKKGYTFKAIDA